MRLKRQFYMVAMLITMSMVLASCGGGDSTPTAVAPSVSGGNTPAVAPTQAVPPTAAPANNGSGPAIKDPNTIVESNIADPASLDPAWQYDTASSEVDFNVYETLLFNDRERPTEFVPMLAEKMPDISADGKTYTFTIHKGIKFDEGQDLTPEDVAYSFWRGMIQDRAGGPQWIMLQPMFGLDVGSFQKDVVDKQYSKDFKAACEAVKQSITFDNNAGTVVLHLKQPYGPMLQILTGSWAEVLSKQWVIQQGGWNGDCATASKYHDPKAEEDELFNKMNGTGPYKFDRWAPGEEVDLVRNDNYWLKQPLWNGGPSGPAKIQRVIIKNVKEFGTRLSAFEAGDADIVNIPTQYVSQVDPMVAEICEPGKACARTTNANAFARLYKNLPSVGAGALFLTEKVNTTGGNTRLGSGTLDGNGIPPDFFSDIHIRKAFNYCFDWDTYIKQIYIGEAQQALGPMISGELGYDPNQAHYTLDLQKCADEFKAATLKSADGKSVWDTGFKIQFVYNDGNDQRKSAGEILKDGLQQVNPKFQVDISSEPFAAVLKEYTDGALPISAQGWLEDFHDPHDWALPYLSSNGYYSGVQAFPADLQKQMDTLITQGISSSDPAARDQIYKQLQNMAYENALNIFTVQPLNRHYEQTWVKGWYYNPTYVGVYFYALSKGQ